jgi:hypothetical protein
MTDDDLADLGRKRKAAWLAYRRATAKVQTAVLAELNKPGETEEGVAKRAQVDRMTIRKWRGKR